MAVKQIRQEYSDLALNLWLDKELRGPGDTCHAHVAVAPDGPQPPAQQMKDKPSALKHCGQKANGNGVNAKIQ